MSAGATRERGIIFTGANVRAIREGRKTQTRRVLKPQPERFAVDEDGTLCDVGLLRVDGDPWPRVTTGRVITLQEVRFAVGQRLWVRETWQAAMSDNGPCILYRADNDRWYPERTGPDEGCGPSFDYDRYPANYSAWASDVEAGGPWASPIHMPRWASRLTLAVTDVRVERLRDISEADADAEGFAGDYPWKLAPDVFTEPHERWGVLTIPECYGVLWNSIHGPTAWAANPWVAAITFAAPSTPAEARGGPEREGTVDARGTRGEGA